MEAIVSDPFYLYERESKSRSSTGYHVFMRCSFRRWKANAYTEERKMELIRQACREKVILRLDEASLLPPDFNKATDNPFDIAPFTSTDFKQDMMSVVAYHWNLLPEATKTAWRDRAERLNNRPLPGQFNRLPLTYLGGNTYSQLHKLILKRDFSAFIHQVEKKFRKYENKTGLYNKSEKVGDLKQQIENKFYFFQTVPYTVILSIFGRRLEKFYDFERVDNRKGKVASYHVLSQARMREIMTCEDLHCSQYCTYDGVEVLHSLCSFGHFNWVDSGQSTKFYGWKEDRTNREIVVRFNNYNDTQILSATFELPSWNSTMETYSFGNNLSQCTRFRIASFYPIMMQINQNSCLVKIIASRACETIREDFDNVFNTTLCS